MGRTSNDWRGASNLKSGLRNLKFAITSCAALFALCSPVTTQQPQKVPRIGVLIPSTPAFALTRLNVFREGLRDFGYEEGKNVVFEYRYAEGKLERLTDLASELVRLKVDLVYTASEEGVLAAKNASKTIPIVFGTVQDPLPAGSSKAWHDREETPRG